MVEVNFHAGAVGGHLLGVGKHLADDLFAEGRAAGAGVGDDFAHDLFDEPAGVRVSHQFVGVGVEDDGQAVVGDVPDQFLPAGQAQVRGNTGRDARALEIAGDFAQQRLMTGQQHVAVVEVTDVAGADFVGAEETQAAGHALWAGKLGELFFDAESVLHDEDQTRGRQQFRQQMVLGGLQAKANDVAGRQVFGVAVNLRLGDGEVAVFGFADQAVLADVVVIGVQKEVHVTAGVGEPATVVAAERAGAEDGVAACHAGQTMLKRCAMRKYFELVRFSHTVFALPFALAAMMVAAQETGGWPGWRTFGLVVAAMVCARTAAMAFNRIVDRKFDALNPRTAGRHLPAGQIPLASARLLVCLSAVAFVAVTWWINRICFYLSPVALAVVFFYSYTKRFTDWSHVFLGLSLGLAPLGAWLAVRGEFGWPAVVLAAAVVFWLVGFDIIYATQDVEFDRQAGLRSLPARLGVAAALRVAQAAHALMAAGLVGFGLISAMRWPYYVGWAVIVICLVWQHFLARKQDPVSLNTAFFRMNAIISVVFVAAVALG